MKFIMITEKATLFQSILKKLIALISYIKNQKNYFNHLYQTTVNFMKIAYKLRKMNKQSQL